MSRVVVIGGGAAGMMAAVQAAENGHAVTLLEKNEKLGKKLFITGKGRCNLTNNCEVEELLQAVCVNRRFLYSAFYGFSSQDTMDFFEQSGLRIKTERGNRVFPVSDHSSDVIAALAQRLKQGGVKVHLHTEVQEILTECAKEEKEEDLTEKNAMQKQPGQIAVSGPRQKSEEKTVASGAQREPDQKVMPGAWQGTGQATVSETRVQQKNGSKKNGEGETHHMRACGVRTADGTVYPADAVIVATGGLSYRSTGSTGDGYRFAREAGHTVTELSPSLVPMETADGWAEQLQGLSLRNVEVTICDGKKELYREFGEMLFTHYGVSGPLILTASTVVQKQLRRHPLELFINLKPALREEQLDARILREFEANRNKYLKNILGALYPAKLVPVMLKRCDIPEDRVVHDVSREERKKLVAMTREFPLTLTALRDYNEAIVTRGGVSTREVNPATMESKLTEGLYFAGEVLDLDAVTGGFNLQIAWATGCAAGRGVQL